MAGFWETNAKKKKSRVLSVQHNFGCSLVLSKCVNDHLKCLGMKMERACMLLVPHVLDGCAGIVHVTYRAEKEKKDKAGALPNRESLGPRHNSLMTIISGGFKKFFDDDKEKDKSKSQLSSIRSEGLPRPVAANPQVKGSDSSLAATKKPLIARFV